MLAASSVSTQLSNVLTPLPESLLLWSAVYKCTSTAEAEAVPFSKFAVQRGVCASHTPRSVARRAHRSESGLSFKRHLVARERHWIAAAEGLAWGNLFPWRESSDTKAVAALQIHILFPRGRSVSLAMFAFSIRDIVCPFSSSYQQVFFFPQTVQPCSYGNTALFDFKILMCRLLRDGLGASV